MKRVLVFVALFLADDVWSETTPETPKIDGRIHDEEWADAVTFDHFYITIPKSDGKYYDSTRVYVKQTRDALYFAFKFWPRGKVIRQSLIRDRSTDEENEFFIVLDLENKNQNGYIFASSFLNNQRDMAVYNQRNLSNEWDWIWENRSVVYREATDGEPGYIESEVRIPVDKIQNKNPQQIGIDFQLFAYKPDGTSYFYSIIPESELMTVKGTYKLDIQPFDEKLNLNVNATPYVVANKFTDSTLQGAVGGEVTVGLDKHKLKGTFHTDESTLEADPFDFSLYGRPIFLQEKRPFFSKDLDIYRSPVNLLYTRAIYDIQYGLNYTYRSDHLKTGLLYVEEEAPSGASRGDRRRFLAARPKYDSRYANLGATVIVAEDPIHDHEEKIVSVDGRFNLPSRFVFQPQIITNTDGQAYNMHLFYEYNQQGGPFADLIYRKFDRKFDALTLFNNYGPDNEEYQVSGGYKLVRNAKTFYDMQIYVEYYMAKRSSDDFKYQEAASVYGYYKATDWLVINHGISWNRPNDMRGDTSLITRKNFLQDHNAKFIVGSNAWYVGYQVGPYFGKTLYNPYTTLELIFFKRLALRGTYLYLKDAFNNKHIVRMKADYRVMDKLYVRSFFQRDTGKDLTFWNSLIQYEFFAGSNIYVVLNLLGNDLDYVGRYFKFAYEFNF